VWAVVVPQSLAYATLAGVPSVNGLYAAVAALAAYAVFGTCRDLNMGAESTVALMAAAAVAPLVTEADDVVALTSLAALLVGGWCVLGFVFRLGFISEFLSRPILAGYIFGSGIIIVVSQLEALFGLDIDTSLYTTDIGAVVRNLGDADGLTTFIGLSTVVLVLGLRKFLPKIPARLSRWCRVSLSLPSSISTRRVSPSSGRSTQGCPYRRCRAFPSTSSRSSCCRRSGSRCWPIRTAS
jgi:SulP family sulfate permease